MTYSAASPILGTGTTDAQAIAAWFLAHNPAAPAGAIGAAVLAACAPAGVNGDLVAAQIAHETGFWTSDWAVSHNNSAGLGVTGAPGVGLSFRTPADGITAQVAHLLTYVLGAANPLRAQDPRYQAATGSPMFGRARVLSDLDGYWAVPGVGYGAAIATLANELLAFAAAQRTGGTTVGRDPQAIWKGTSNYDQGRAGYVVDHITDHMTAGTDSVSWLMGPLGGSSNKSSSATYLVSRDGTIYQFVDEADTPWSDGNLLYNRSGISIEHEALEGQAFTDAQITTSIGLHARIAQRQGWASLHHPADAVLPAGGPPGTASVIGHAQVPDPNNPSLGGGGSHHLGCPGPLFPWQRIVDGANALLSGQQPAAPAPATAPSAPEYVDDVTRQHVGGGFYDLWQRLAADQLNYRLLGRPLTGEFEIALSDQPNQGYTTQLFERAALRWDQGAGLWDRTTLLLPELVELYLRLIEDGTLPDNRTPYVAARTTLTPQPKP